MIIIKPANDKGYFWQWDTGQYLRVDGAPEVHFGRPGEESTIDVAVVDGLARVPDTCLEKDGALSVYAYDSNHTLRRAVIEVLRRQKPAGYIFTPAETKTWGELDKRIEALEVGGGVAGVASVNGETGHVTITADTLGALTQDDLQDATDAALAQAKASGAFDGAPGPQGPQGDPGKDGKDAVEDISLGLTSATVGQIAKITAVDDNGKPTAWEPVDMPSGEVDEWELINSIDDVGGMTNIILSSTDGGQNYSDLRQVYIVVKVASNPNLSANARVVFSIISEDGSSTEVASMNGLLIKGTNDARYCLFRAEKMGLNLWYVSCVNSTNSSEYFKNAISCDSILTKSLAGIKITGGFGSTEFGAGSFVSAWGR